MSFVYKVSDTNIWRKNFLWWFSQNFQNFSKNKSSPSIFGQLTSNNQEMTPCINRKNSIVIIKKQIGDLITLYQNLKKIVNTFLLFLINKTFLLKIEKFPKI